MLGQNLFESVSKGSLFYVEKDFFFSMIMNVGSRRCPNMKFWPRCVFELDTPVLQNHYLALSIFTFLKSLSFHVRKKTNSSSSLTLSQVTCCYAAAQVWEKERIQLFAAFNFPFTCVLFWILGNQSTSPVEIRDCSHCCFTTKHYWAQICQTIWVVQFKMWTPLRGAARCIY